MSMGIKLRGTICPWGPNLLGTICPGRSLLWGSFVQGTGSRGPGIRGSIGFGPNSSQPSCGIKENITKRIDNQLKSVSTGTAVTGNWEVPCYPPLGILSPRWGLPSTGLVLRCSQTCLTLGVTWRMLLTRVFGKDPLDTTSTPPIYRYLVSRNRKKCIAKSNCLANNFSF